MRAFGLAPFGCFRRCSWGAAPDMTIMPLPALGMNPSFQFRFSPEGGTESVSPAVKLPEMPVRLPG